MHSHGLDFMPRSPRHLTKDKNTSVVPEQFCCQSMNASRKVSLKIIQLVAPAAVFFEASPEASVMGRKRKMKKDWFLSLQDCSLRPHVGGTGA